MTALLAAWVASLLATGWLLGVGGFRMVAHRSGQVDHTPGMRNVALTALALGALAAVAFVVLTVVILARN